MNLKLFVGIALFLVGILTAVIGIAGVGDGPDAGSAIVTGENPGGLLRAVDNIAIPVIAGLSLAIGGLLIGLSMGNWRHPRTHLEPGDEVVDPEGYTKMKHV